MQTTRRAANVARSRLFTAGEHQIYKCCYRSAGIFMLRTRSACAGNLKVNTRHTHMRAGGAGRENLSGAVANERKRL